MHVIIHRIDVIALIAIGSNAQNEAMCPEIKEKMDLSPTRKKWKKSFTI